MQKRWGGTRNAIFFLQIKKCLKCSKTKEFAKLVVKFLQGYPLRTFFKMFPLEPQFLFFHNHPFQALLVSKTCVCILLIHVI